MCTESLPKLVDADPPQKSGRRSKPAECNRCVAGTTSFMADVVQRLVMRAVGQIDQGFAADYDHWFWEVHPTIVALAGNKPVPRRSTDNERAPSVETVTHDPTVAPAGIPKTDTSAHILLCVGPRCTERGARRIFEEVWETLDADSIAYYRSGGSVRLTETGCLGACDFGPTVACYGSTGRHDCDGELLSQTWRVRMDTERIVALARSVHQQSCAQSSSGRGSVSP